jgi:glycerophosphoryl diester phosphodiesterase
MRSTIKEPIRVIAMFRTPLAFYLSLYLGLVAFIFSTANAAEHVKPLVIAHRGASGYLPEHTLEAKVLAFAQGADYLEQDVVMTADDQLLVLHDLTLERTTDVATRYPHRARADGSYYVIDFTLAELRQLRVSEGFVSAQNEIKSLMPGRFPPLTANFNLHTLQEELELVAGLKLTTGKDVGVYVELKSPWFHHQHGKDLATAVVTVLRAYGYDSLDDRAYVQSFDYHELVLLHDHVAPALGVQLKLVQLIAEDSWLETYEQQANGTWQPYSFAWMHSQAGLTKLSTIVTGVGPSYEMLVSQPVANGPYQLNQFVSVAHAAGLQVHPYTFRADPSKLPVYADSFTKLLTLFIDQAGVDGVFTDFPDLVVQYLQPRNQ